MSRIISIHESSVTDLVGTYDSRPKILLMMSMSTRNYSFFFTVLPNYQDGLCAMQRIFLHVDDVDQPYLLFVATSSTMIYRLELGIVTLDLQCNPTLLSNFSSERSKAFFRPPIPNTVLDGECRSVISRYF